MVFGDEGVWPQQHRPCHLPALLADTVQIGAFDVEILER
jgi:hypothetical protein